MQKNRRTNLGGSIASFIVVGVILMAGLIGAVYFLNQRIEQTRKEQEIASSEKKQNTKKSTSQNKSNDSSSASNTANEEGSSASSGMPTTGPEVDFVEILGLFLLPTVATGYVISRRKLTHSL